MQEISSLFKQYLDNKCTAEEIKALLAYFGKDGLKTDLKLLILDELKKDAPPHFEEKIQIAEIFNQTDRYLHENIFAGQTKQPYFSMLFFKYAAAASIICILSFTVWRYNKQQDQVKVKTALINDAQPGVDKAILTLADGSSVALTADNSNAVFSDKGIKIKRAKDGALVYEITGSQSNSDVSGYNVLATPNGAKYEVLLPDGTRVWLNAGSSLKYPLKFAHEERRVALTGEAYFEVAKLLLNNNRIPFYVETPKQIIKVLGTEFNISAYNDDPAFRTTLVSGKVDVQEQVTGEHKILSPGEQAVSMNGRHLEVVKVNAEKAVSWKDGDFSCEDMYLKDILRQLSRWYNVKVDYNDLPETRYNIFISRDEKLSAVLRMLEKTGNIKFQITNNTIKINH
ncbi:FecR family protein [Pedobacter miscanthi]|uniref:FecR family protein n=1 Tax=Pedobacter miscanthi TaxID=2259170 RepID=UPI00293099A0|nr:FecR family protein [Pedobacter miscanthi]